MVEGKASMSGTLSPYAVLGVGIMQADADVKVSGDVLVDGESVWPDSSPNSWKDNEDDTVACGKVGLGVDWWATPDVTVGFEGSYVFGFEDADFEGVEVGVDYFTLALGIAYHF